MSENWYNPKVFVENDILEAQDLNYMNFGISEAKKNDWNVNIPEASGYIANKPMSYEELDLNLVFDNTKPSIYIEQIGKNGYLMSEHVLTKEEVFNATVAVNKNGDVKTYNVYNEIFTSISAAQSRKEEMISNNEYDEKTIFILNGFSLGAPSDNYIFVLDPGGENIILAIFYSQDCGYGKGIIFIENSNIAINSFRCIHSEINIDEKYQNIFKHKNSNDVYLLDLSLLYGTENASEVLMGFMYELSKYQAGDVLLIPTVLIEMLGAFEEGEINL